MPWQDFVFTGGSLLFVGALISSVLGKDKPALPLSLTTALVLSVFTVVYATLDLWFTAIVNAIMAILWFVLVVQHMTNVRTTESGK